jgi:hypothetical protein
MTASVVWLAGLMASAVVGLPVASAAALQLYPRPCRLVLGWAVGAFLLSTAMTLWALAGIPWSWPWVLATSVAAALLVRRLLSEPGRPAAETSAPPGVLGLLIWVPVVAAALAVGLGGATSMDLLLFWGPKAQAFAAARTIDVSYLMDPLHAYLHPSYPPLVTSLFSWSSMAAGRFSWRLAGVTLPLALAGLAAALPGCFRRWLPARASWAMTAVIVSAAALWGAEAEVAGNADAPLLLFEILAMVLLVSPDASRPSVQWLAGILLGGAATTKVEGLPFVVATVLLFLLVVRDRPKAGPSIRLLLPMAAALAAWFALGATKGLFSGYEGYGEIAHVYWSALPEVLTATARSLWETGYGLPLLIPLAMFAAGPAPHRMALLPVGVVLVLATFFLFTYLHLPHPSQWILWSAPRLLAPVGGLLVIAAAASMNRSPSAAPLR